MKYPWYLTILYEYLVIGLTSGKLISCKVMVEFRLTTYFSMTTEALLSQFHVLHTCKKFGQLVPHPGVSER